MATGLALGLCASTALGLDTGAALGADPGAAAGPDRGLPCAVYFAGVLKECVLIGNGL